MEEKGPQVGKEAAKSLYLHSQLPKMDINASLVLNGRSGQAKPLATHGWL